MQLAIRITAMSVNPPRSHPSVSPETPSNPTVDGVLDLLDELQSAARDFDNPCCKKGNCSHEKREIAARLAVLEHCSRLASTPSPTPEIAARGVQPIAVRVIGRQEFDEACNAVWTELQYQDALPRRTDDEAKDPQGFATLGRVYLRKLEDDWAMNPGPVEAAFHDLRKLSAVFVRGMIYCGIRTRPLPPPESPDVR
jgi:hypothetical protein